MSSQRLIVLGILSLAMTCIVMFGSIAALAAAQGAPMAMVGFLILIGAGGGVSIAMAAGRLGGDHDSR